MALVVDNLTLKRGERTIIDGLSFRAERGEALLLTGANGSGKTTVLRALAGLLVSDGGRIEFAGGADEGAHGIGEHCHFIGHLNGFRPALTVAENADFWADYLGGSRAGVTAALEHFRLAELAPIQSGYLSAGQKRRLGLARLLLAKRPVWLLDEPAVSLDTASQQLLAEAVGRHLAEGGIVVASTHQPLGFAPAREHRLGRVGPAAAVASEKAPKDTP